MNDPTTSSFMLVTAIAMVWRVADYYPEAFVVLKTAVDVMAIVTVFWELFSSK